MPQADYLIVCDLALSSEHGKHCIVGVFDQINASAFPALHPSMGLAIRLFCQSSEALKLKVELGRPNGDVFVSLPIEPVAGSDGICTISMTLNQLQFPEPGRYTLRVLDGKNALASRSLRLVKVDLPQQAAPPLAPPPQGKLH